MQLSPAIAIHLCAAVAATVVGPVALWARRSGAACPWLHRAAGYAWVTLMLLTAASALFIRGGTLPRLAGFSPIHIMVPVTLVSLFGAFWYLARGRIQAHRRIMVGLYVGACLVAGSFALLPNRLLGHWVWTQVGLV